MIRFQLKKLIRNRLLLLSVFSGVLVVAGLYFFNMRNYERFTPEYDMKREIEIQKMNMTSEDKDVISQNLNDYHDISRYVYNMNTWALEAYEKQDYEEAYAVYNKYLTDSNNAFNMDKENVLNQKLIAALQQEKLPAETNVRIADYSVSGMNFVIGCNVTVYPYLLTVLLCLVLSFLYTSSYHDKVDSSRLLPITKGRKRMKEYLIGFAVSIAVFLFYQILPAVIGSAVYGTGSLRYPYMYYDNGTTEVYRRIHTLIPSSLLLYALDILVILLVIHILSKVLKNGAAVFAAGTLLCSGSVLLMNLTDAVNGMAHNIPFTYLNAVNTVSGKLAYQCQNPMIRTGTGMLVLGITIVILLAADILLER